MTELITWLRAQLDEDERVAREAPGQAWVPGVERQGEPGHWKGIEAEIVMLKDPRPDWPSGETILRTTSDRQGRAAVIHASRHDPARVLAEVDAKRRILDLHDGDHECSTFRRGVDFEGKPYEEIDNCTWVVGVCSTVKLLALPYANRPGYREEWRP